MTYLINDLYNAASEVAAYEFRADLMNVLLAAIEDANQSFADGDADYSEAEEADRALRTLECVLCGGDNGPNGTDYDTLAAWFRANGFKF